MEGPCSSFALVFNSDLAQKETDHTNFALNISLSVRPLETGTSSQLTDTNQEIMNLPKDLI